MPWAVPFLLLTLGAVEAPVRVIDIGRDESGELRGRLLGELRSQGIAGETATEEPPPPLLAPWIRIDAPTRATVGLPSEDSSAPPVLLSVEVEEAAREDAAAIVAVRVVELIEAWRKARAVGRAPEVAPQPERIEPSRPRIELPVPTLITEAGVALVVMPNVEPFVSARVGLLLRRFGSWDLRASLTLPFESAGVQSEIPATAWFGSLRVGIQRVFHLSRATDASLGFDAGVGHVRAAGASADAVLNSDRTDWFVTFGPVAGLRVRPISEGASWLSVGVDVGGFVALPSPTFVVGTERLPTVPVSLQSSLSIGAAW